MTVANFPPPSDHTCRSHVTSLDQWGQIPIQPKLVCGMTAFRYDSTETKTSTKDGKVCLSLLGTWAGPGWVAGKSTLLQASKQGRLCVQTLADHTVLGSHFHPVHDSLRGAVSE